MSEELRPEEMPEEQLEDEQQAEVAGIDEEAQKNILRESLSRERIESIQRHISKRVKSIVFGVLSPKMIKKMASAKVVTPELYDKEGYPVDGGLMDVRLGVIDPGLRCKTCGSKLKECIGHFGYIELARPVIHINYIKIIYLLLKSTCADCGRVLIPEEKIRKYARYLEKVEHQEGIAAKRNAVKEIVDTFKKVNKCPHCSAKQEKVVLEKPSTFIEGEKRLTPIDVRSRLEKVPDQDLPMFGINPDRVRPEWLVITIMPVPPVTVRPSITLESGERSEDDLTHKMGDIVRINQRLFENINAGAPEIIIEDLWDLLQYHVTTFFDNNVAQLPPARHRNGQPLKTVSERIKSKDGRIRKNLAGKRVNFCARTVISPDPMIGVNEVGVPEVIGKKLTVPEVVNEWNMKYLQKFIENGPDKYPGCNYIIRPDGKRKKITDETKEAALEELQPGYVVERHLLDGDVALFNRQPSLHRMSMMCHRVRVLPYKTLRLNPAVCAPYNADFDGDEMNLHVPQTEESRAEAEILMEVQTQLISPGYGRSAVGCIHDGISGNYLLTKDLSFDRKSAIDILTSIGWFDFKKVPKKKEVSGKEIFSVLIPDDFSYIGTTKQGDKVEVRDGKLIEGYMDIKGIGGEGNGDLLRLLHRQYGPDHTVKLLHFIFKLGIEILLRKGITSKISDIDLSKEADDQVEKLIAKSEGEVKDFLKEYHDGTLELIPGFSAIQTLEARIMESLNKARNACGKVIKDNVVEGFNTAILINSGARGSILNLVQMGACVGQQALRGKRIDKGYGGRTLSCFKKGDLSPEARGFVRRGFKKGLNPKEFFFHAITGRDGLMDTALRTPKSGYLYRRLANALQDLRVEYDDSVRDANGQIIQFEYGEDGIDVSRSASGKIDVKRIVELMK